MTDRPIGGGWQLVSNGEDGGATWVREGEAPPAPPPPMPSMARIGVYPVITDPRHPLYEEASAGWPTMAPDIAMLEAQRHASETFETGYANSRNHPAFAKDAIVNEHAELAGEDTTLWLPRPDGEGERR